MKDSEIDLVLILTSMNEHSQIAEEAIKYGKHVLVEKPMATNMTNLNKLYALAKKSKKFLIAAPFVTLSPVFQAIHQELNIKK